jgi:deazaflavin-dependent oxidoreductase (nitroreductase family)
MAHDTGENRDLSYIGEGSVNTAWKRTVAAAGGALQILWRIRLGWVTGHAFLVLTHVGRHTGRRYRTVLYVQRYNHRTCEATVISVWGPSQWFRNISVRPANQVEIGWQRYQPRQRFLTGEEIVELQKRFRARHRIIAWGQARLMGWPWPATDAQLHLLAKKLRGVAFSPGATGAAVFAGDAG